MPRAFIGGGTGNLPRISRRQSMNYVVGLALILAFGWPALTLADCGWVLWSRTRMISETDQTGKEVLAGSWEPWEPLEGFDPLADCRKKAADQIRKTGGAAAESAKKPDALFLSSIAWDDNTAFYEMKLPNGRKASFESVRVCFPGGFDPRPR